jgi:hypothetical protein
MGLALITKHNFTKYNGMFSNNEITGSKSGV